MDGNFVFASKTLSDGKIGLLNMEVITMPLQLIYYLCVYVCKSTCTLVCMWFTTFPLFSLL